MFWGLVLEPSKKYTQKVDQTFHISQAALDLKSSDLEPIQLVVEYENSNFVLATLSKKANIYQVPLDLIFKTGDQVSFRTIGNGKVHLSGYHVFDDLDSIIMNGEEESDTELEEMTKGKLKRKKPAIDFRGKKAKLEDFNEYESDDDDDDDDELDEEEDDDYDDDDDDDDEEEEEEDEEDSILVGKGANKKKQKGNSLLSKEAIEDDEDEDEDDEDEDEDDDDDDDDDDDEEEAEYEEDDEEELELFDDSELDTSKKKGGKVEEKKNAQTPNGVESGAKGKDKTPNKTMKQGTPNKNVKQGTPNKNVKQGTPNKNVKQGTPNKNVKQGTPKKDGKTPKSEKKQGNAENNTPQRKNTEGQKKEDKTPKTPKSEGSPQKKVLEGGVIQEDIRIGNGPVAKPGKMANVYYVGTLASTKKEFDSVQSGGGFKFRVGRNEVIKGWDIGINGMKVGGKRKLTIPPHLAYGSRGSPPVIPPNSTLVFTIELKGIS